jgi:ABC-type transport system involved in Fe-S cluster assembly fused permease/ATPase subunit
VLFNDSLLHNLRYGRPDASEAQVLGAATAARLDATLETLPMGLETMVGERGVKLSGGEKQRVVRRCRLTLSNPVFKAPTVSALETGIV